MDVQLGTVETKFADLIWEKEPVSSAELVRLCADAFGWKKSTTYTVLKRLCDKGLFQNENGTVTSRVSGEVFHAAQSKQFVDDAFGGSLPAFLAAFMSGRTLSDREADEIREMIRAFRKEG